VLHGLSSFAVAAASSTKPCAAQLDAGPPVYGSPHEWAGDGAGVHATVWVSGLREIAWAHGQPV
jgi:hypothetical protein